MGHGFEDLGPLAAELRRRASDDDSKPIPEPPRAMRRASGVTAAPEPGEEPDFRALMSGLGVVPLSGSERARHDAPRPRPIPRQSLADQAEVLRESVSDDHDSVEFLESDDGLSFRRPEVSPELPRELRRGRWCVTAQLDLHGMFVAEARQATLDFIRDSQAKGRLCLRIIHGKGNNCPDRQSVLREYVRRWLKQVDAVLAFVEPWERDGGAGATLVRLRAPTAKRGRSP